MKRGEKINPLNNTCSKPNHNSHKCDIRKEEDEMKLKWRLTPDFNLFFACFDPYLISI